MLRQDANGLYKYAGDVVPGDIIVIPDAGRVIAVAVLVSAGTAYIEFAFGGGARRGTTSSSALGETQHVTVEPPAEFLEALRILDNVCEAGTPDDVYERVNGFLRPWHKSGVLPGTFEAVDFAALK